MAALQKGKSWEEIMVRHLTLALIAGFLIFTVSEARAQMRTWHDRGIQPGRSCNGHPIGSVWYGPGRNACGQLAEHRCVTENTPLPPPTPCHARKGGTAADAAIRQRNEQLRGAPKLPKGLALSIANFEKAEREWNALPKKQSALTSMFNRIVRELDEWMQNIDETNLPAARAYVHG